jgi:hypothetical protein
MRRTTLILICLLVSVLVSGQEEFVPSENQFRQMKQEFATPNAGPPG